jgi:quinol-cytochrome oxidoreductase complex cytochrome b subunit
MTLQPRRYFLLHFRPKTVPERTLALNLSWGLGGLAAVLVLLQTATGLLLKFAYEPTPQGAYASVQYLIVEIPFGRLVRNLHHWGANLLVGVVVLHLLRVCFTGAFHAPRRLNWVIGLGLLMTVLLSNFTGYLLPWDQLAYWAVTVSTGMLEYVPWIGPAMQEWIRGGPEIGSVTLRLFFAVHTALVPALFAVLMGFHFWRVRKAGGLVIPRKAAPRSGDPEANLKPQRVPAIPHLIVREAAMAAVGVAAVLLLAIGFDAPLEGPANPGLSPNPTQAPWYFAGFQELLLHVHPTVAVFIVPVMATLALAVQPFLRYQDDPGGIWFISRAGRRSALAAALLGALAAILWIAVDHGLPGYSAVTGRLFSFGLPMLLLAALAAAVYGSFGRRGRALKNEGVQAAFVFAAVGFAVMTLTSAVFRGEGMALGWPW